MEIISVVYSGDTYSLVAGKSGDSRVGDLRKYSGNGSQ